MKRNDRYFLQRAVDKAIEGIKNGGGPFGAVIARDNEIISEAGNQVVNNGDPTAHAEILAIRMACDSLNTHLLNDCTIYTSCEPCPMCLGAIYWAGIKEVVYAADRKDAASAGFGDDNFYEELQKDPGERTVIFRKVDEIDGKAAFRAWDDYENKIPY